MPFLYDTLLQEFGKRELALTEVPNYIVDNRKYEIRPYQTESFQRYILCFNEDFEGKEKKPKTFSQNKTIAKQGGTVAGNTRKEIEEKTGKKVVTRLSGNKLLDNKNKDEE